MQKTLFVITLTLLSIANAYSSNNYTKALELYNAKKWTEAQSQLSKVLNSSESYNKKIHAQVLLLSAMAEKNENDADKKILDFLSKNPQCIFNNSLHYSLGKIYFNNNKPQQALEQLLMVNPFKIDKTQINDYNYLLARTYFSLENYTMAEQYFNLLEPKSPLAAHGKYHIAYMNYISGKYDAAKQGFNSLASNPDYQQLVPYYLLHLEYLQDNFSYATNHGAALAANAVYPRDAEILRLIAESWYHLEDYRNALLYMNLYKERGGTIGRQELYISGFCNYKMSNWQQAVNDLNKATGVEDKLSQNAGYHLAFCYLQLDDKHSAMQSFSIAASSSDGDPAITEDALFNYCKLQYETSGSVFNESINILTRYIKEYPNTERTDKAREYLLAAYYNSKNYKAAYQAISLLGNPDNNVKTALQKISYYRALEYFTLGDITAAEKLLEQSMANKFNPKYSALTSYWQAEIYCLRGDFNRAIPLFKNYLQVSPKHEKEYITALYGLGSCYFNLKNWKEASNYFNQFLKNYKIQDSFSADASNRLADISLQNRSYWDAIKHYDNALKIDSRLKYYSSFQRAMVLGMLGRDERKIESLEQIITLGEGDYIQDASFELARSLVSSSQYEKAATVYKEYLTKYPESPKTLDAYSSLGLIYLNLKQDDTALEYYTLIVSKSPHSPEGRSALERVKGIYVNKNNIDAFYKFATDLGVQTDKLLIERDSLTYVAAEKIYLSGHNTEAQKAMSQYLENNPQGAYKSPALYYAATCAISNSNNVAAIKWLEQLTAMHINEFTISANELLSGLYTKALEFELAAQSYAQIADLSTDSKQVNSALLGQLEIIEKTKDSTKILLAANHALASELVDDNVLRIARFTKAKLLPQSQEAFDLLTIVSSETHTEQGAESTYLLIENQFNQGNYEQAEEMIINFSDKNSPHTYWVGKSFLLLGDIYVLREDNFQARATYQSIVDGYMDENDGILAAANEKIKNLK